MCKKVLSLSGIYTAMRKPEKGKVAPAPKRPESNPRQGDAQMMQAMEEERKRQILAGQRNSTNLTGSQGLTTEAPTQKKTLLGQ